MNIKIEITSYDKDNKQTLGLDLTIYHRNPAKAKELAKALLDAVVPVNRAKYLKLS